MSDPSSPSPRPATWAVLLALGLVYVAWGTTYFAIKVGVEVFPPALFGGTRLALAGVLLLGYLAVRGESVRIAPRELMWLGLVALFMFVGGNLLVAIGQKLTGESGEAAVLVASTPLWMALFELFLPWGDRLTWGGWLGLGLGLVGVGVMMEPTGDAMELFTHPGRLVILASALCWAVGSFVLRHRPRGTASRLAVAAYQLVLGGVGMCLVGVSFGELGQVTAESFTHWPAVASFFYLLVFGSFVGFLAYLWLLDHVSAALAGSHAYVNPVVALVVGWGLGREDITGQMLVGMAIILGSVFLVRGGVKRKGRPEPAPAPRAARVE